MRTAAEKLTNRIGRIQTPQLIEMHGMTLNQMYAAADAAPTAEKIEASEPHTIVVDAIADELVRRGVQMTSCCYCPAGTHDPRACRPDSAADALADAMTDAAMKMLTQR